MKVHHPQREGGDKRQIEKKLPSISVIYLFLNILHIHNPNKSSKNVGRTQTLRPKFHVCDLAQTYISNVDVYTLLFPGFFRTLQIFEKK